MSFKNQDLSVIAYANGFTLWNYQTADALADVKVADYFNEAGTYIRKGDMILTVANMENTVAAAVFVVSSVENGVVEVVDFTTKI